MNDLSVAAKEGRTGFPGSEIHRIFPRRRLLIVGIVAFFLLCACATATVRVGEWVVDSLIGDDQRAAGGHENALFTWAADSGELTVAVSPTMASTLLERAEAFNGRDLRTADGERMQVKLVTMSPQEMVERSLRQPNFQALAPDSSLWLRRIDQRWAEFFPTEAGSLAAGRVGQSTRFAVSPIVIAAWEDVARQLGWPEQAIGWKEFQARATADATFRWTHPGADNAVGTLATLAAFYAGAGITRGLTEEIASRPHVLDYVRKVEATVLHYGEGQQEIVQRLTVESRSAGLDAFVTQEQTVIAWNRSADRNRSRMSVSQEGEQALPEGHLVAIYPKEGTLWADHPLALLELDGRAGPPVTDNQRRTYQAFTAFLQAAESQFALLQDGYRPVDLTFDLNAPPSPFAGSGAVDARQPLTVLQIPAAPVMEMMENVWRYAKRPANVYLVVDTSESMQGQKLDRTKAALYAFVDQMQGDRDRVGLVEFGSGVKHLGPLHSLDDEGRAQLLRAIENMQANGYTALVDAVRVAHAELQSISDADAVNAIVVLTDGRDNDSYYEVRDMQQALQDAEVRVRIFTIAFGRDADRKLLEELARISGGQFSRGDQTNIEELYRIISTFVSQHFYFPLR